MLRHVGVVALGASALWLWPGLAALLSFAWLLVQVVIVAVGRAFAAYGGVGITATVLWMWLAKGHGPDGWDIYGTTVCLGGAAIFLAASRSARRGLRTARYLPLMSSASLAPHGGAESDLRGLARLTFFVRRNVGFPALRSVGMQLQRISTFRPP